MHGRVRVLERERVCACACVCVCVSERVGEAFFSCFCLRLAFEAEVTSTVTGHLGTISDIR